MVVLDVAMAEQLLDGADIVAVLKEVVAKECRNGGLAEPAGGCVRVSTVVTSSVDRPRD